MFVSKIQLDSENERLLMPENLPVVLVVLTISAKTINPCRTTSSELSDNIPNNTGNNPLACADIYI